MVLSLVDLSISSVINGMMNGTIQHPHLLYPMLRQRVMDTAQKNGFSDCLELLTSVEFLTGMTSISAKACNDVHSKFLERLISSLATKLPNGETIGSAITELNLKVFDYGFGNWIFKNKKTYSDVISKLSDLIAHCPNTKSLDLNVRKSYTKKGYWPFNQNENSACNQVMENLINLSVVCNGWNIVDIERPIINFKKLTTLKLEFCTFDNGGWPKLLEKIPFVENLHFCIVYKNEIGLDWLLPFPLPYLKSLEIIGRRNFECTKAFVDNLVDCPELRQVQLILDEKSIDEESLVRLANMDIDLKMKIQLHIYSFDVPVFDSSSRFKIVSIFHDRMDSFEFLDVWQGWDSQCSTALEDVFNTCSNLTSFGIKLPRFRVNQGQATCSEEKKRFNTALVQFFGNPQRAQKLEGLRLEGNFDETVLAAVFESCPNLVRLNIRECSNLRDQHLIDWVARGGGWKLAELFVEKCNNVTSEGIIPILAKSANGLLRYLIDVGQDKNGRNWKTVLYNLCRNARKFAIENDLMSAIP